MKQILSLILVAVLAGCTSDPVIEETPSTMMLSKKNLTLTYATPIDSATVRLSCGCGFNLVVENFTGDTSAIRYQTREVDDLTAHTMAMVFSPAENTSAGSYSAKLAFLSTGKKGNFRDTVTVHYTR